jgi:hypothetical protein
LVGEGVRGIKKRIQAWKKRHNVEADLPVLVFRSMPAFRDEKNLQKIVRTVEAKLGGADLVIVDTAMRAASGLNLNMPAESQDFIDACEYLRQNLDCSVEFIHHTGKDASKGHLGAENLIAAVDVADEVNILEKSKGRRLIEIKNKKLKDEDTRDPIYLEATLESLGHDEEGAKIASLVLDRCHEPPQRRADKVKADQKLELAIEIIEASSNPLSMSELAEEMAKRDEDDNQTDDELRLRREKMRNFLREAVNDRLKAYARKSDPNNLRSQWNFTKPSSDTNS